MGFTTKTDSFESVFFQEKGFFESLFSLLKAK